MCLFGGSGRVQRRGCGEGTGGPDSLNSEGGGVVAGDADEGTVGNKGPEKKNRKPKTKKRQKWDNVLSLCTRFSRSVFF